VRTRKEEQQSSGYEQNRNARINKVKKKFKEGREIRVLESRAFGKAKAVTFP